LRACDWLCHTGYYYPDKKYLDSDELSFTRPVEVLEPAWFSWYELDQYKIKAPTEYYSDIRRYLPNTCQLCTHEPPTENPCGYGEYWSNSHCSSAENNGCKKCINVLGESARYIFPNPIWQLSECPSTCGVGYYDSRPSSQTLNGKTSMYPGQACVACPPPLSRLDGSGEFVPLKCDKTTEIYFQCGTGMGNMGMDPLHVALSMKVFNWNGACQSNLP